MADNNFNWLAIILVLTILVIQLKDVFGIQEQSVTFHVHHN
jgi:hypothetical protein